MGYWKQIVDANWKVPYEGGWCLKYVQDAFATDHPYGSAMEEWNANPGNGNHPWELPPVGKTVPVYFSLGSTGYGHTAICLDDGMVASSTQEGFHSQGYIHPNLQNMIDMYAQYNNGCTYLGWSEFVGNIRVAEYVSDNATADQIRQDYLEILERGADNGGIEHYQNFTNDFVRADLYNSDEYKRLQASKIVPVAVPEPPVVIPEPQPEPEPVVETPVIVEPIKEPTNIIITSKPYVDNPTWKYQTWWEQIGSSIMKIIDKLINKLRGIK
jgi:hypothetical protein